MSLLTSACASTGASLVLVTHDPTVAARLPHAFLVAVTGGVMAFGSRAAVAATSATADDPSSLDGMASFYVLIVPIISMGAGAARLGCSRGVDLADVGTMVAFLERCSHYTLEELEVLLGVSGALSLDGAQRHALGREGLHFVIC